MESSEIDSLRQNNREIAESLSPTNDFDDWIISSAFVEEKKVEKPFPKPLVDYSEEQLIPLDPESPIWVSQDRIQVILVGEICLQEGVLEFFACSRHSKEHESIVALDIQPYLIHAALLLIGAEPGEPARFSPEFVPPQGPEIHIRVRWKDDEGQIRDYTAQQLVLENTPELFFNMSPTEEATTTEPENLSSPDSSKEMSVPFVFTGSLWWEFEDENGNIRETYLADATGELFGVSNFPSSILDVPIKSPDSNDSLLFCANPQRIPPVGTEVTLILELARPDSMR